MKITESSLKRIIREELKNSSKNIVESVIQPGKTIVKGRPNLKSEYIILNDDPDINKIRVKVKSYKNNPKHKAIGYKFLLSKIKDDHPLKVNVKKIIDDRATTRQKYDAKRAKETAKGPVEARVMKMLKFYDTAVYGSAFGTFISRYNGLPGAPAFIAAGPRFAGDLGMLVKMPADLSGLETASRSSLPKTDNKFANNALEIANRLVSDLNPDLKADLADMLTKSMSGGMTLQQITDAKAYLEYLQALVKKNFASYGDDSDGKKARTKSKQQKALVKLLKQVKQRGPDASAVIMRLNEAENDSDDLDVDKQLYGGDVIPITGAPTGRNLVSGNILSKFITPNITPAKLSKNLKQYNNMAVAAIIVAENLMTGASKLHDMMKKDADAAKYITQFILSN